MLKLWREWGVNLFSKYLIIIDNLIQTGLDKVRPRYTCQHTHNPEFLHLLWRGAISQNISFETPYGGQFTSSTQLIKPKLACYTLPSPPTQHHTYFTNIPPLYMSITINSPFGSMYQHIFLLSSQIISNQYFTSTFIWYSSQGIAAIPPSAFYSPEHKYMGAKYIRFCFIKVSTCFPFNGLSVRVVLRGTVVGGLTDVWKNLWQSHHWSCMT